MFAQGQRALDFVLRNQGLIDKTLLFDVELLKIVPNWCNIDSLNSRTYIFIYDVYTTLAHLCKLSSVYII